MRSRAYRRAKLRKMKNKARRVRPWDDKAKGANHLAVCSCWSCGNPRKHWHTKTLQEIKQDEKDRRDDYA